MLRRGFSNTMFSIHWVTRQRLLQRRQQCEEWIISLAWAWHFILVYLFRSWDLLPCLWLAASSSSCHTLLRKRTSTWPWCWLHPNPRLPLLPPFITGTIHFHSYSAAFIIFHYFSLYLSPNNTRASAVMLLSHSYLKVLLHTPLDNRDQE